MKTFLLAVFSLFVSVTAFSQKNDSTNFKCGDEEYTKYLEKTNPEFYRLYKEKLNNITTSNLGIPLDSTTVYRIPVVFRIYHLGETVGVGSNTSESNIKMALNAMNQAFRGIGRFEGLTVDTKIEFVLASRKPDGTATNGIERIDGRVVAGYETNGLATTNPSDFDILGLKWTSHYYRINVYHKFAFPAAGFAFTNSNDQHVLNQVVREFSTVLAHEAGHNFGLNHTFLGDGGNQICPINNNPNVDGDGISDTDPHKQVTGNDSSAINPCTSRSFGRVIYNIMSYSNRSHFTQKQKEKMRYNLINYQQNLINSPALLSPNSNNVPIIPSCVVANGSGNYSAPYIQFKLNNLIFSGLNSSTNGRYIDYTKFYTPEPLVAGQTYTFSVQADILVTSIAAIRLYIDFNNDGDFDDLNENQVNYNGNITTNIITFNITIPTNAVINTHLRMRFVSSFHSTNINSCYIPPINTGNGSGSVAADFSIKIFSNCTNNPPIVASINTPNGQSGTLQSTGCNGTVKWYDKDQNFQQTGNSFTMTNIQRVEKVYATCTVGLCESYLTNAITITPTYNITITNNTTQFCTGTNVPINFTHNFPPNTYFTIIFRKGSKVNYLLFYNNSFINSPYNFNPSFSYFDYGIDYSIEIISGQTKSNRLINLTIGNLSNASFLNNNLEHLGGSDYLCTGTTKEFSGKLFNNTSNPRTEIVQGITYQWMKNNVNEGINQNPITVSQSGNYSLKAMQGSCVINSNAINLSFSITPYVYIQNQPSELNLCDGIQYGLSSNYSSNTATFQWKKNDVDILGATNRILLATTSGLYSMRMVDGICNTQTSNTKLNFGISLKPQLYYTDTLLCNGSIYFSVSSAGNTGAFDYQWQKDGLNIPNANLNYYYVPNPGMYRLLLSQGNCSSFSKEVSIATAIKKQKPVLTTYGSTNICSGSIYTYFNNSYCTLFKDNVAIYTGYYYDITQSGTYKLKTSPTDNSCTNESDPVVISIGSTLIPVIKQQQANSYIKTLPILCGSNDYIYLQFQQPQSGTFTYQWQENGVDIPNEIYNYLFPYSAGNYRVRVTNGTCTAYSNVITVTQDNGSNARIITDDNNLECSNRLAQLELVDGHWSNINWFRNGVLIPNENSTKLFVNSQGNYTVTFNNNNGCAGTTPPITINSKFVSKPSTTPVSIIIGQNTTLTASGCSGSISWYDAIRDGNLLGVGSQFITPTLNTSTFYFPSCTVNGCNSNRTSTLVSVNPCTIMYSVLSGNWNTNAIWSCNRQPTITDNITISSGHTVTIPSGATGFLNGLNLNGVLINNGQLKYKEM